MPKSEACSELNFVSSEGVNSVDFFAEEEIKRLNQELAADEAKYSAVGFSYDASSTDANSNTGAPQTAAEEETAAEEADSEFIPPKELALPRSMVYVSQRRRSDVL